MTKQIPFRSVCIRMELNIKNGELRLDKATQKVIKDQSEETYEFECIHSPSNWVTEIAKMFPNTKENRNALANIAYSQLKEEYKQEEKKLIEDFGAGRFNRVDFGSKYNTLRQKYKLLLDNPAVRHA